MVDFDEYFYYPALMSRVAEIQGLRELSDENKDRIIPLFTLGRWHNAIEFNRAIENCSAAIGNNRVFFADLTREVRHQPDGISATLNPDNNFSAWRAYVERFENAIPVVQMVPDASLRQVVRQAQLLERTKNKVAFRIRNPAIELPFVINSLSALDETDNAIIFLDVRYIRGEERIARAVLEDSIDRIRSEVQDAKIVTLCSSFPPYLGDFADDEEETRGSLEIVERQLHASVVSDGRECIYGDYASIHPIIRPNGGGGAPIPRIDVATPFAWHFERRPTMKDSRPSAYTQIAGELLARWDDSLPGNCWGAQMIHQAANGDPHGLAAQSWIAVRVNLHLTHQILLSDQAAAPDNLEEDF